MQYVQTMYKSFTCIVTNNVKVITFICCVFCDKVKIGSLVDDSVG